MASCYDGISEEIVKRSDKINQSNDNVVTQIIEDAVPEQALVIVVGSMARDGKGRGGRLGVVVSYS